MMNPGYTNMNMTMMESSCYIIRYIYDENGNMILKITNGDETEYTYDKYGVEIQIFTVFYLVKYFRVFYIMYR